MYLHPKDLLTLARSSKDLRSLFLSRTTLFLWKAARSNVPDMPPCPEDMSEPAYASLMFDTHCSVRHIVMLPLTRERTQQSHRPVGVGILVVSIGDAGFVYVRVVTTSCEWY